MFMVMVYFEVWQVLQVVKILFGVVLWVFFNMVDFWKFFVVQQMMFFGIMVQLIFFKWKLDVDNVCLLCDMLECIFYLFGIYCVLQILLLEFVVVDVWLKKFNDVFFFGGCFVLDCMLFGNVVDFYVVW